MNLIKVMTAIVTITTIENKEKISKSLQSIFGGFGTVGSDGVFHSWGCRVRKIWSYLVDHAMRYAYWTDDKVC